MLVEDKVAIVYGAGAIGGAVARPFSREGAVVHLADHNDPSAKKVATDLRDAGAKLETAKVNALDRDAVEAFVDSVVAKSGRVDVSFCAVSTHVAGGEQGLRLSELTYEDFALPIIDYTKSQFLTANAAAKHMVKQGSGVILMITAVPSHMPFPYTAGFGPAWAAVEALSRTSRTWCVWCPHRISPFGGVARLGHGELCEERNKESRIHEEERRVGSAGIHPQPSREVANA